MVMFLRVKHAGEFLMTRNKKGEMTDASVPAGGDSAADLGGPGADIGGPGGMGSDSGGTGAGTTALDAIGFQGNRPTKVGMHLKTRTAGARRGDTDTTIRKR
jgi:hypothetical protein